MEVISLIREFNPKRRIIELELEVAYYTGCTKHTWIPVGDETGDKLLIFNNLTWDRYKEEFLEDCPEAMQIKVH